MIAPRILPVLAFLTVTSSLGCSWLHNVDEALFDPRAQQVLGLTVTEVDTGAYRGLSDLSTDPSGHFWAVPERDRVILRIDFNRPNPGIDAPPISIEGVPLAMDTEAMVWLDPNTVAFGTETKAPNRDHDDVLIATLDKGSVTVTSTLALPYSLWKMRARTNDGIEGVCFAAGHIIASVETVLEADQARFAPIGRFDPAINQWAPFRLKLTSRAGKLSALACRPLGTDQIELMAIERHFGISRLLRFTMPVTGGGGDLTPTIVVELGRAIRDLPNFEGVAWGADNGLWLIADNHFGVAIGPTRAVHVPPQPSRTVRP